MIWLRLLGVFGWLKNAALSAFSLARRYPLQAALLCAVLALFWQYRAIQHVRADRDAARHEIAALIEASNANRLAAERQVKERQAALDKLTKDATNEHEQAQIAASDAVRAYAASHRLRQDCGISAPATVAEGNDTGVPAEMSAHPRLVGISETDLQALVDWLAIGVSAHNQAVDKVNAGVALPDPAFGH